MLATALIALVATAPPSRPIPLAPVQKYRIELSVRSEVDLTGLGMPAQVQEQGATSFITVTLSDSAGGNAMLVAVDSATFNGGDPAIMGDVAAQTRGLTFRGFVDATGRVHNLVASSESIAGALLQMALGDFFPRNRPGATPGQKWSDTLDLVSKPAGGNLTTHQITEFTAGAREPFHGQDATALGATFTTLVEGTMETPAGPAGMTGSGSGTGNYYISASGTYLGGSRTTNQKAVVTLAGMPSAIPVNSTTVLVVTPLP